MALLWRKSSRSNALLTLLLVTVTTPLNGESAAGPVGSEEILVLAAASTALPLEEAARLYSAHGGGRVKFSFASTSALSRQVEAGIPGDIFLSANTAWMDRVEGRGHIIPGTRFLLFSNRLVLVAPADSEAELLTIEEGIDLRSLLENGRLALGETESVPAGIYAREALTSLGIWESVRDHLAPANDVRHATTLVQRGDAPLGIVYRTEVLDDDRIRVLGPFPKHLHSPIAYWIAALAEAPAAETAKIFLAFLQTPEVSEIFTRYGFEPSR